MLIIQRVVGAALILLLKFVLKVWFGEDPCVVVTDYNIMKDTFQKEADAFAGRHFLTEICKAHPGLIF